MILCCARVSTRGQTLDRKRERLAAARKEQILTDIVSGTALDNTDSR